MGRFLEREGRQGGDKECELKKNAKNICYKEGKGLRRGDTNNRLTKRTVCS